MSTNCLLQQQRMQFAPATTTRSSLMTTVYKDFLPNRPRSLCHSYSRTPLLGEYEFNKGSTYSCVNLRQATVQSITYQEHPQFPVFQFEDYRVYQNVDLEMFFGDDEQKCEKVSDVCLMNDHYIFVKMPDQIITHNTRAPETVTSVSVSNEKNQEDEMLVNTSHNGSTSKFARCFKCSRSSNRISPIQEDQEKVFHVSQSKKLPQTQTMPNPMSKPPIDGQKVRNSWNTANDVEVFQSRTHLKRNKPYPNVVETNGNPLGAITHSQCSALVTSLHDSVNLKLRGELITTNNDDGKQTVLKPKNQSTNGSGFGPFALSAMIQRWFMRAFKRNEEPSKTIKTQSKINAAVHKIYFVRWAKPPETLWHGYGVEHPNKDVLTKSKLRRCRSAVY